MLYYWSWIKFCSVKNPFDVVCYDIACVEYYPIVAVILAVGVKESSRFNNLFTMVNLLVVTYIVICGSFKADVANWSIDPKTVSILPGILKSSTVSECQCLPLQRSKQTVRVVSNALLLQENLRVYIIR